MSAISPRCAAALLAAECPTTWRARPDAERCREQWKALAEAGVLGLAIDEEHGGSGGS